MRSPIDAMRTGLRILAFVAAIGTLAAQDAVIRAGDSVGIRIGGVPMEESSQISGSYQVDGQGFINLTYIGRMVAAGKTQAQLQAEIENKYRLDEIFAKPTIIVSMSEQARFVNVGGDVRSPGRVSYTPDLTVLTAINASGGFTEYADQKKVRLLRDGKVIMINVPEIRKDPTKDIPLKPGDSIEVPQSFWG